MGSEVSQLLYKRDGLCLKNSPGASLSAIGTTTLLFQLLHLCHMIRIPSRPLFATLRPQV